MKSFIKNKLDLSKISTEERNIKSTKIDQMNAFEIATLINKEDQKIAIAIKKVLHQVSQAIEVCASSFKNGGRIIYLGAGTSGRLGILDASEMLPTYGIENNQVLGLIAGGKQAIENPVENAEDNLQAAIEDLKVINFSKKDVLIGISASGRTPYVVSGLQYANQIGAKSISIATSKNSMIGKIAEIKIEAITGAEVISGSTRMKSGTAQKMILNMISTGTMVLNGFVYENLMINIKCKNEKLKKRAENIVSQITNNQDFNLIRSLLEQSNFDLKTTILAIKKNIAIEEAKLLFQNNDFKQVFKDSK